MKRLLILMMSLYILCGYGFAEDHVYVVVGEGNHSYVVDAMGSKVDFEHLEEELEGSFYYENVIFPEIKSVKKMMNGMEVEVMTYVFGLKDYNDQLLAAPIYDMIIQEDWGYLLANGQQVLSIDNSGQVIKEVQLTLAEGSRIVSAHSEAFVYEQKNGAQGRISYDGQLIEEAKAAVITYLDESVIHYRINYELLNPEQKGQYGVMIQDSKNSQVLLPLGPSNMGHKVGEGLFAGRKGNGSWFFIDYDGNQATTRQANSLNIMNIGKESEGVIAFAIRNEDGQYKWGYMTRNEEVVIKPKFNRAGQFKNNFAVVDVDGKKGLINKAGDFVILPELDAIQPTVFKGNLYYKVQLGDYTGLMDSQFSWLVAPRTYAYVNLSEDGIYIVKKSAGKHEMGLLDLEGNGIVPCQYSSISSLGHQQYIVEKDGANYLLETVNNSLTAFDYTKVRHAGYDYLAVSNNGEKWGIATLQGQLLTEMKFDRVGMFRDYDTLKIQ